VAAFAVAAVGTALVVRSSSPADRPGPDRATAPVTADPEGRRPSHDPDPPAVSLVDLPGLGASGLVAASDVGLVNLSTGDQTPMLSPADTFGTTGPTALPDGAGGVYYISSQVSSRARGNPATGDPIAWPELRHLSGGRDTLVETGVTSVALRSDGALAVAVGRDPVRRQNLSFEADVVVVAPDGTRTTWSPGPGEQQVVAWAGDRLLVERGLPESEATSLHVLDGPGPGRELSPQGRALAVGPDGRWAVVAGASPGEEPVHDAPPADVPPPRVVDLGTGAVIGSVDPGPDVGGLTTLTWVGDDRLLGATFQPSGDQSVVELAVAEGADGTVSVTRTATVALGRLTFSVEDLWAGADGTVMALASATNARRTDQRWHLYVCQRDDPCDLIVPPFGDTGQVVHVANPSRPRP